MDFIVSLTTLQNYYMVVEPLLSISHTKVTKTRAKDQKVPASALTNQNLPLAYIECRGFRVIVPSKELGEAHFPQNVCMFQVEAINLTPNPVNPICRVPCRPDIYQQAARARILQIPGSEVEDRQYQLDIVGISLNSGTWEELVPILKYQRLGVSNLKTMIENPALEWNKLGRGRIASSPELTLWPIMSKFDVMFVAAPAMVYKNDVVCGHSVEVNIVSDIQFNVALSQIKLAAALLKELNFAFVTSEDDSRPEVILPYSFMKLPYELSNEDISNESPLDARDSGFETSDIRSNVSFKSHPSIFKVTESERSTTQAKSSTMSITTSQIPLEVLFAAGKISFILYEYDNLEEKSIVLFKHKKSKPFLKDKEKEKGYEASEEGSMDEKATTSSNKIQPLLYLALSQPNMFFAETQVATRLQISCYNIGVKISSKEYKKIKSLPEKDDFPVDLLETKSGEPHPDTGILPAFLTVKLSKGLGSVTTLDVDVAKPMKLLLSMER